MSKYKQRGIFISDYISVLPYLIENMYTHLIYIKHYTLIAIVFRYYAIVHPLKAQYLCTVSKAKKTIILTWIMAFILAIPIIFVQVRIISVLMGLKYDYLYSGVSVTI